MLGAYFAIVRLHTPAALVNVALIIYLTSDRVAGVHVRLVVAVVRSLALDREPDVAVKAPFGGPAIAGWEHLRGVFVRKRPHLVEDDVGVLGVEVVEDAGHVFHLDVAKDQGGGVRIAWIQVSALGRRDVLMIGGGGGCLLLSMLSMCGV